ncbi:MAG TPA: hypothetical protein VGH98_01015 [Gemmatimonadaceae bacterium]|jgi:hypothetical protein
MHRRLVFIALALAPSIVGAQAAPNECFGFKFGAWDPPLRSVASAYNPGYDPATSAPVGTPRDWAARVPNGGASTSPADSVLMLFPAWWPVGLEIQWTEQRGDTLIGRAVALVADGRLKNPVTSVRGVKVACGGPAAPRSDTSARRGS